MAHSRLEKIGNIFTRTTGLLRSGAMKPEERPLWYDIYAAYPPIQEPKFDRPAPGIAIRNIFYAEDKIRAKFHKLNKNVGAYNLSDAKFNTQTQQFIEIYNQLAAQGALDDEKIYETAMELLRDKMDQDRKTRSEDTFTLVADFKEASAAPRTTPQQPQTPSVNISDIFKS